MVFVVQPKQTLLLLLYFGKETTPAYHIVLILVVEDHLRVDEVFDYLLAAAICEELGPRSLNAHALFVVVRQGVHMQVVVRPHVNVRASSHEEDGENDHGVDSVSDDGALAKTEVPNLATRYVSVSKSSQNSVPYLFFEVVREAEAALLAHSLETSTAPMHGILCQEEEDRQDDEGEQAKHHKRAESNQSKKLIWLMFDVSDNFDTAELAHLLHWSDHKEGLLAGKQRDSDTYSISKCSSLSDGTARDRGLGFRFSSGPGF